MKNKTSVLILGASGFIGKNLVEQLSLKYRVLSPSKKELNLLDKDRVNNYFKKNKHCIVIYCANIGGTRNNLSPKDMIKNNLTMFFNVASNQQYFKRLIFLGSGAEYNKSTKLVNVAEDQFGKSIPSDDYGFYKYVCSKYIESTDKIVNLRLFGVFGKYEDYSIRFISNAICRSILNLPIEINQNAVFDYVYVDDLVEIIDLFIKNHPKNNFYNVGSGEKISLYHIAQIVSSISQKKIKIKILNKNLKNEYSCSNKRLLKEFNKFKFTPLEASIKKLYNYYLDNEKNINSNII